MKVIVFDQWDKLVAKFKGIATAAMDERTQYDIVRVEPKGGRVQLADRSMNNLAVSGGATAIAMPVPVPHADKAARNGQIPAPAAPYSAPLRPHGSCTLPWRCSPPCGCRFARHRCSANSFPHHCRQRRLTPIRSLQNAFSFQSSLPST